MSSALVESQTTEA